MAARRTALLLLSAAALAAGCALRGDDGGFDLGAIARVSEEDERSLGAQVDQAIRAQLPLIDDPVVLGFANDLGQRIVATIEPQPFVYRFRVIPNSTLNAFALPGGYVYLHSGTILEAATLDELAGVVGHEIAHVKGRHYARGTEQAFWPSLLARAAGIAAAVATGEGGFAAAAEGANVALQLKYSREFEREADELGSVFMARAGFRPIGMARFFSRIVAAELPGGIHIPPYLYSHPDVEQRIDDVEQRAAALRVADAVDPALEADFRDAQARLALLIEKGRTSFLDAEPYDRTRSDPLLAEADAAANAGRMDDAIAGLRDAERREPREPRIPFRLGELLDAAGLADGRDGDGAETVAGAPREEFALGDPEVAWWARLDEHYAPLRGRVRVRWIDPSGARAQEGPAEGLAKKHVGARLPLDGAFRERFGVWRVEATLEGQVIDRRSFSYSSSLRRASSAQLPSGRSPR